MLWVFAIDRLKILKKNIDVSLERWFDRIFMERLLRHKNNDKIVPVGELFDAVVQSWTYITHLDVRMCNFSKESEHSINEHAYRWDHRNKRSVSFDKIH